MLWMRCERIDFKVTYELGLNLQKYTTKGLGRNLNCPILCGQYKKAPWQEILSF